MLAQMGIEEERLRLEWVSASEGDRFASIVNEMTEQIRQLGPFNHDKGGTTWLKLKIALYWAASCGGCEIAQLQIGEKLLKLVEVADIVFWPVAIDVKVQRC